MGGPCFLMVWEGRSVVSIARKVIGATNPQEAEPGTIRGDFGIDIGGTSFMVPIRRKVPPARLQSTSGTMNWLNISGSMNLLFTNTKILLFLFFLPLKATKMSITLWHCTMLNGR